MQYYPSFLSVILAVLSPASYNLWFLCLASKCRVSHWPSLLDIPGSFHPFRPSFISHWFSNFYLHRDCTSDLQIPIIHSSPPSLHISLGPQNKCFPKWLPHLLTCRFPSFPHLDTWHYFRTKTCIYPQFLLFLLHHHILLKDGHTPVHQKSYLNCHHHLSAGLSTTAS